LTESLTIAGATAAATPWVAQPGHLRWLDRQTRALDRFGRASVRPGGGFWWLDEHGRPDPSEPLHTWIACRMTHVYALALLAGDETAAPLVDHGITALTGPLRDAEHDGWYGAVAPDGSPADPAKAAYPHAFVVLAAASATRAGRPGARALLDDALTIVLRRFYDDGDGRTRESWSRAWDREEPYRGANSSMHMVEAFLAAADATGDPAWADRALRICAHLIHDVAAAHDWRLPEHFTPGWEPVLDYHADKPADQFRPYGATVGHALEWARLLMHVETAVARPPAWLRTDARALFVGRGWAVDGADGFVYTLDWTDTPVVHARMHWVLAEAIGAAAVLGVRTGDPRYEEWYRRFWDYAQRYLIDGDGGWHHELDRDNRPAATVWHGRPDVYHAYQATLLPRLPVTPALAGAVTAARTDRTEPGS
jgi:mannose/cellobiose epimerase-like protein (N-acyl-D-glucosamine 2-epimerase family)